MLRTFLQENQFITSSYQHYGGTSGFQDYGILGCKLKNQLQNLWRTSMMDSDIHEVEIPAIVPNSVLKASGHIDRFSDYVIYDVNGTCYRADHLAKKWFEDHSMFELATMVDSWDLTTLEENINKYNMLEGEGHKSVNSKNLMIEVPSNYGIGYDSDYLRPELAQGIFVNFKIYCAHFQHDDSAFKQFGIAQIGRSYRKEISPQPFVRMREFTQAEIEYFFDPDNIFCENFALVEDLVLPLLTEQMQSSENNTPIQISLANAVTQGLISHKLMAYFLGKIFIFAKKIGLHDDKIRFRQHQRNEMAHYANQCWDLECLVGGSWLECVGCADRGNYDLTAHSKINPKQPMTVRRKLTTPKKITCVTIKPILRNMSEVNPKSYGAIKEYFSNIKSIDDKISMDIKNGNVFQVEISGQVYTFHPDMFTFIENNNIIAYESFIPHVLEPSFGIDRLIYAVLEQNIWHRKIDERRLVLSLPNDLILYDLAVFPLHKKEDQCQLANKIRSELINAGFRCYTDDTGTAIGKKYVRTDEIGVRHVITVDPGSLQTGIVTIRDRDTMDQINVHFNDLITKLKN